MLSNDERATKEKIGTTNGAFHLNKKLVKNKTTTKKTKMSK